MSRFAVDPESLMRLAASVRAAAEEAEVTTGDRHSLPQAIAALRDPVVTGAVNEFIDRWSYALRSLIDDAHRIADAADVAARLYRDADLAVGTVFGGPAIPGGAP